MTHAPPTQAEREPESIVWHVVLLERGMTLAFASAANMLTRAVAYATEIMTKKRSNGMQMKDE